MKKHRFSDTHIEHHDDGSATIHHVHEDADSDKDVKHAVSDFDGIHGSLIDHLDPDENMTEDQVEEKIHPGIHSEVARTGFAG